MAKSNKPSFARLIGNRSYKKRFVIVAEGEKTEIQYFDLIKLQNQNVVIACLRPSHSSPLDLLQCMKRYLSQKTLLNTDEAWLVVDKDDWIDKQLNQLFQWSILQNNYGLALSNPSFEYWLLLHFEGGHGITTRSNCLMRLKKYLPNYDKDIIPPMISKEMIYLAIDRAKSRDNPPCCDWPRKPGITTIYKLIERILSS